MRKRDKIAVGKSVEYKRLIVSQFEKTGRRAYPIVEAVPEKAIDVLNEVLRENRDYDVIFVDLPGSISSKGVLQTIVHMDYVLTPIVADRMVMQSTLGFASAVLDYCKDDPELPLKEFLFVWNKVDRRASTEVYSLYAKILERLELHVLDTVIPESCRFDKELSSAGKPYFRSTLLPPSSKLLKGSNIDVLAEELCKLLNI
jgi:cellulose biosynthesis protein BcsQ